MRVLNIVSFVLLLSGIILSLLSLRYRSAEFPRLFTITWKEIKAKGGFIRCFQNLGVRLAIAGRILIIVGAFLSFIYFLP